MKEHGNESFEELHLKTRHAKEMSVARREYCVVVSSNRGEETVGWWNVRTAASECPPECGGIRCDTSTRLQIREISQEWAELPLFRSGETAEEFDKRCIRAAEDCSPLTLRERLANTIGAWGLTATEEINEDARVEEHEVHTSPSSSPSLTLFLALDCSRCGNRIPEWVIGGDAECATSAEKPRTPAPCELNFNRTRDETRISSPRNSASELPERPIWEGDIDTGNTGRHTIRWCM